MIISGTGALDAVFSYPITLTGDWSDLTASGGAFNPRVTGPSPSPRLLGWGNINGNNYWYIFDCEVPGITIYFQQNRTQAVLTTGGIFRVKGSSTNCPLAHDAPPRPNERSLYWVLPAAPNPAIMWQINVNDGVTVDMAYDTVCYSDARAHPIAVPEKRNALYGHARWNAGGRGREHLLRLDKRYFGRIQLHRGFKWGWEDRPHSSRRADDTQRRLLRLYGVRGGLCDRYLEGQERLGDGALGLGATGRLRRP